MSKSDAIEEMVRGCVAFRARLVARAVSAVYDKAIAGHGLTIAQLNLLAALGKLGNCAPSELGHVVQLERSTVSRNLELLISEGWVKKVSSDAKGIREVALSAAGLEKIKEVLPDWRAAQREIGRQFGRGGVAALGKIAAGMWANPNG